MAKKKNHQSRAPHISNRRARFKYHIEDTLECGLKLTGTEVKSIRVGNVSLAEGYVRTTDNPAALTLHGVHIA